MTLYTSMGMFTLPEQYQLIPVMANTLETRAYGNNYGSVKNDDDNLKLAEFALHSPTVLPQARRRFREQHWPAIWDAQYRFYSVDDFLKYHLTFAEKFSTSTVVFRFEGPEEEPDCFGKHDKCTRVNGQLRGCDICELLVLLDKHLPEGSRYKPVAAALEDRSFSCFI